MDRLISLEPSNLVAIRIEPGQKCGGELTLRNVMYTMPVAFQLQPNSNIPDSFPRCDDSFLLHSVVVPGAAVKNPTSTFDAVPIDWFTTKRKQVFIDSGIKIMFVGSPVLAKLIADGTMEEIREVLERSDPEWKAADSVDSHGQTLLHLAISQSRADLVQILLEFEPDMEAKGRSGSSPLEAAAGAGETLIVELLLARKANTERSETSTWGPIHLAAGGGHVDVLRLLLLKGANPDSLTKDGNTALHLAVEERRRDCARLLLANGARSDFRNSADGDTPLHIAAGLGDEHMVKLLLQKGANKDIRNKQGKMAYDIAAEHGHTRLFDVLRLGDSFCLAARKGEVRTIHRLLENGAAINGRDQHGWTALHRASFKGRVDAVRALLDKGIDIFAKDEDGYTALHCAAESGHADVIELLVKKGADIEARSNKGVTALQIAESLHYVGITRILVRCVAGKDGFAENLTGSGPIPYGKGSATRETEIVSFKKKTNRTRALRGSFDQSIPLAVL